jgi:hypothetical protein
VTSTTSKIIPHVITAYLTMIVLTLIVGCLQGCAQPEAQPATKTRIVTPTSSQAETQESPKPSPAGNTAPAEEPEKKAPFYGTTYWDELLTSVYYYPKSAGNDVAKTHLKFNHREDDIWLCGDQRKFFTVGERTRLTITFELDQDCATNWQNRVK